MRRLNTSEAAPEENPDTPEILDNTHVAIRGMMTEGRITEDVYYKNVVSLAMRWLAIGRHDDATGMLCELPPDYIRHTMRHQMAEDDRFRQVAFQAAQCMSEKPLDVDEDDVALAVMLLEKPVAKA